MIEIYHFRNRFGKQCVAVFGENDENIIDLPDFVRDYIAGMDPPEFNLPAIPVSALITPCVVYIVEHQRQYDIHDEQVVVVLDIFYPQVVRRLLNDRR